MENKKLKFNFVKKFNITVIISSIMVIVGIVSLLLLPFGVNLFNFDIEFLGGTSMQFNLAAQMTTENQEKAHAAVESIDGIHVSSLQATGAGDEVIIKTTTLTTEQLETVTQTLEREFPGTQRLNVESISPIVGQGLQRAAVLSAIIASALILLYITIRFQFRSGVAAIISLTHDLLTLMSVYVIFRIPMNMNFIAAALTILGYSINATIVVFDRIRENRNLFYKKNFDDIVNESIWQSMARSINTTLTTLLSVIVLIILGVPSIQNFCIPLAVGIACGAYSSVAISGPMWALFARKSGRAVKKA